MYKKIVIGVDQSYSRCGISIAADSELKKCFSLTFGSKQDHREIRKIIYETINKCIVKCLGKTEDLIIILERTRTISQGKNQVQGFGLKPVYLKETGKIIGTIVDLAFLYSVDVYSVDTRAWKSKVLGSSQTDSKYKDWEKPEKATAILFVTRLGFDLKVLDKHGEQKKVAKGAKIGALKWDDDAADSGCIALYGFIPKSKQKLIQEF